MQELLGLGQHVRQIPGGAVVVPVPGVLYPADLARLLDPEQIDGPTVG